MENLIVTNWAVEDLEAPEEAGASQVPKGIRKKFVDVLYNQLEVDPYWCTLVATFTALSNMTGKVVPYSVMRAALKKISDDGKFRSWFGANLSDGVQYALDAFNSFAGTKYRKNLVSLSDASIYAALDASPVVTGIKYSKDYFPDEQDNGIIDLPVERVSGSNGHAVSIVKVNTEDDVLVKFAENYAGKLAYNVILCDFGKKRKLFFNTGYWFS